MKRKTDAQTIKVVYGIDRNYLVPAAVSIHSLCERASAPLEIVVYGDGLEPPDRETLLKVGKASGAAIDVRSYDPSDIGDFRRNFRARWPAIVTLPLELPWLVEGRCLFIDADTLVVGDVGEIMAIDMKGMPLGACVDPYFDGSSNPATAQRLIRTRPSDLLRPNRSRRRREAELRRIVSMGLRPGDAYFNAGVLVMECDAIRALAPPRLPWALPLNDFRGLEPYERLPDQDRLNEFFVNRWRRLPMRWNLNPMARAAHWPESARRELDEALSGPGIWHFMGSNNNPWDRSRSRKWRLRQRHPAFRAWHDAYGKVRDLCGLEDT